MLLHSTPEPTGDGSSASPQIVPFSVPAGYDAKLSIYCAAGGRQYSFQSTQSRFREDIDCLLRAFGAGDAVRANVQHDLDPGIRRPLDEGIRVEGEGVKIFVNLYVALLEDVFAARRAKAKGVAPEDAQLPELPPEAKQESWRPQAL